MKRIYLLMLSLSLLIALFSACGKTTTSSQSSQATSTAASAVSETASTAAPASEASAPEGTLDVKELLATLSEAASLGGTIPMSDLDLTSTSHISMDNIVAWAGAESQLASENGGIVIVVQAKPGTADTFVTAFEQFRDAKSSDDRYAEYATAIANTKEARIVTNGDYVVYAVSATGQEGGYDALDAALNTVFNQA